MNETERTPGMRAILERHVARHILDDSEGEIEADLIVWHERELRRYGELVKAIVKADCEALLRDYELAGLLKAIDDALPDPPREEQST